MGINLKLNTITQLKDLRDNAEGLISGDSDHIDNRIWVNDVKALDNAIEIIQDWLFIINNHERCYCHLCEDER